MTDPTNRTPDSEEQIVTVKPTTGLTEAEASELHELEIAFEHNGGRGVEDAERIDELRRKRGDDLGYDPEDGGGDGEPVGLTEAEASELEMLEQDLAAGLVLEHNEQEVADRVTELRTKRDGQDPALVEAVDDLVATGVVDPAIAGEFTEQVAQDLQDMADDDVDVDAADGGRTNVEVDGVVIASTKHIDLTGDEDTVAEAMAAELADADQPAKGTTHAERLEEMRDEWAAEDGNPADVDRWVKEAGIDLTKYEDLGFAFEDFDLWLEENTPKPDPVADAAAEAVADVDLGADEPTTSEPVPVKEMQLVYLDVQELRGHPRNVREDLKVDEGLVNSIREQGVIEPLTVVPFPDGGYLIVAGHRRAEAAFQAGRAKVPCVVRTDMSTDEDDNAGQAEHVSAMLAENLHREGLTTMEEVRGVQALLELGVTPTRLAKKTGLGKKRVAKALGAARLNPEVAKAVDLAGLTLDQAAAVALFADDQEAAAELIGSAEAGPGHFAHKLTRLKQDRERRQQRLAKEAELVQAGRTLVESIEWQGPHNRRLSGLTDAEGNRLEEAAHVANCPGAAVVVSSEYNGLRLTEVCMNPGQYGHKESSGYGSSNIKTPVSELSEAEREAAAAERRLVIDNNKAMTAANTTRREWLKLVLKRRTVPYSVWRFCLDTLEEDPRAVSSWLGGQSGGGDNAQEALGIRAPRSYGSASGEPTLTDGKKVGDQTLAVKFLAHVAGALECNIDRTSWRRVDQGLARWLRFCVEHGYTLSEVEQLVVDQAEKDAASKAAFRAEQEAEAAARREQVAAGEAWQEGSLFAGLPGLEEDDVDFLDAVAADHVRDGGDASDVVAWAQQGIAVAELKQLDDVSDALTAVAEWVENRPVETSADQLGIDDGEDLTVADAAEPETVPVAKVMDQAADAYLAERDAVVTDEAANQAADEVLAEVELADHVDGAEGGVIEVPEGQGEATGDALIALAEEQQAEEVSGDVVGTDDIIGDDSSDPDVDVEKLTKERNTLQARLARTKNEEKRAATSARIAEIDALVAAA